MVVEVSGIQGQVFSEPVAKVGTDTVQEVSVVRDRDQHALPPGEVVLQPDQCVQVQVVGRLICWSAVTSTEKENVWFNKEGLGEGNPHSPATGEVLCGHGLHLRSEAETGQDGGSAAGHGVGVDLCEAAEDLAEALGEGLRGFVGQAELVVLGHNLGLQEGLDGLLLLLEIISLNVSFQDTIQDRGLGPDDFLLNMQNL